MKKLVVSFSITLIILSLITMFGASVLFPPKKQERKPFRLTGDLSVNDKNIDNSILYRKEKMKLNTFYGVWQVDSYYPV